MINETETTAPPVIKTQQEIVNEAAAQLPDAATYSEDFFNVDFYKKDGSSAVIVGTSPIRDYYFKKQLPMRVMFKKIEKNGKPAWDIVNPLDGFKQD